MDAVTSSQSLILSLMQPNEFTSFSSEVLMFFCGCGCFSARKPYSRLQPPPLDYLHHLFILPKLAACHPARCHGALSPHACNPPLSPLPPSRPLFVLFLTLRRSSHSSHLKEMDSCVSSAGEAAKVIDLNLKTPLR